MPRNSPRPGSRSKIGASKSVACGSGSSATVQRIGRLAIGLSLAEHTFALNGQSGTGASTAAAPRLGVGM